MGRAPCCDKVGLRKGRWTAEEDKKLREYVNQHGEGSWRSLPKNAGLLRCGKSCRLRWINYLREDLKRGKFSKEEEDTIIKLHATIGNRWSVIAGHLPGRTDNEIKNYWNSHLSRKIHTFWKIDRGTMDTSILAGIHKGPVEVIRRKGGRTSRSNMKKINITIIKNNNTYVVSETRVVDSKRQSGDDSIVTTPSTTSSTITTTTSARVSISDDARRMLNDGDDGNEEVVLDEGLINELLRCIEREENEEDARVLNTDSNDDESLTVGTSLNNEYQVDALLCNGEQEVGSSTSSSEARCQVMTSSSKVNMQDTTEEAVNTFLPRECNSWLELDGTQGNLWEEEDIWPMIWKDQGTGIQSIDTMDDWLCLDGL